MAGNYRKLGKNTLILTIGNFSSKILNYLLVPLYTYALTTSEYGVVDLITTTVTLLIPILTISISEAIMRFALDNDVDKGVVISFGILLSICSSLLILALSPLFRMSTIIDEYFFLFVGVYFSHVLVSVLGQFAKGCENVKAYTVAAVIQTASFLGCNILFLITWHWGTRGYLLANIISNFLNIFVLLILSDTLRYIRILHRSDFGTMKKMVSYSVPLIPNNISWWVSNSSDKYILNLFFGTALVGLYSTAYKIPSIMQVFTTIFWSAWQISAVEDFGSKSSIEFFSNIYRLLSSMMSIVCGIVITLSELIALFAFQKDFFLAWKFTPILVFSFLFSGMSSFLGTIYTSAKKTKSIFISTTVGALLNIILNFVLIPEFNGYGAAIATLVSYFSIWIFRIFDSRKIIQLNIEIKKDVVNYIIIIVMSVLMLAVSSKIKYLLLCVCIITMLINEKKFLSYLFSSLKSRLRRQ